MAAPGKINTIKAALVTWLETNKATLGAKAVKSIKQDISPQDVVEAIKQELPYFPALLVNYAGRTITRQGALPGGTLISTLTYAIFVADRNLAGPFVSGESAIELTETLVEKLDGQRLSNAQKTAFEFTGDQLMFQDASTVIYQLLFTTQMLSPRST